MTALSQELEDALRDGDLDRADGVRRRMQRQLNRLNSAIEDTHPGPRGGRRSSGPTQRETVLGVVAAIGDVAPTRVVRDIAAADGTPISATGFPAILRSDERSWRRNPRRKPVLLLPGLESTTLAPLSSWIATSTFDIQKRIVTPLTPRAAHLRSLNHVLDRIGDTPPTSPTYEPLLLVARRLSVALPELRSSILPKPARLKPDVEKMLAGITQTESVMRREAAERLSDFPQEATLFGFRDLQAVEVEKGGGTI